MKKLSYLFVAFVLTGLMFIASCSKDSNDPTPIDVTPVVSFKGGTGYTSVDALLIVNEEFKVGITAFSNATSNAKLTKFTITRTVNNIPETVLDSTINTTSLNIDIIATANSQVGTERWSYKVTDKDGKSTEKAINITTKTGSSPIISYTQKVLGSYNNATIGSSFASSNGNVYKLDEAKTNAALIDWLYFYGVTNFATIAAPDDTDAGTLFNNATNGLQTWAVKNPTRFKKVTAIVNWDTITDDAIIVEQTGYGVVLTKVNNLAVGNVLAFITAAGKKGLIKVTEIVTGSDGSITYDVKVQE
jgi:hypothetical protein